ncbi:MAG: cysteine rich repeat-containing protein [Pseudomonadota bacterium]|nr:cysteine rich repeat-containing protein [Pseudomonadota bacterium]
MTNECGDDLKKHCGAIKAGEGRVIDCMKKNEKALSSRCSQAIRHRREAQVIRSLRR